MIDRTVADTSCSFSAGRRSLLVATAACASTCGWPGRSVAALPAGSRAIPSTGERLPVIGLGSWITFNVGNDRDSLERCTAVIRAFFGAGGALIDSSPMYGSSQSTIGHALAQLARQPSLFSADKVWIGDGPRAARQIEASRSSWGVRRFDLLQVHNLLAWQEHLPRLFAMKAAGELRYVGITTSHGRRHAELEQLMRTQPIDFVQLTYNPVDREVEHRLLPLAADRGIAVIVNRPFRQGELLDRLARHRVPDWARQIGCEYWSQLVLKFIVSHPAVTCAIPATRQPSHLQQNMAAAAGPLPDAAMRLRIAELVARL